MLLPKRSPTHPIRSHAIRTHGFAVLALALAAMPICAQETQQQETAPSSPPGLLNEIGKLLKSPADLMPSFGRPDPQPPSTQDSPPIQAAPVAPPPIAPAPPAKQPALVAAPPPAPAPPAAAAPPAAEPPSAAASTRFLPGMASGRESCPQTANGGPDCQAATDKLCQSKGYKGGRSLATDSAYTCNVRQARAEGRKPCGTEYFVTSAFCN